MTTIADDQYYMRVALNEARKGLGRVAPNPSVGCVIVKEGRIIAKGRTADNGRPHAEAAALKKARQNANDATAYVTLEPCAHPGREAPCASALIKAGIKRTVIACIDPNPNVLGQGIDILKKSGVQVDTGILEEEAKAMHIGFFLRFKEKRPFVTLKLATSLDGKIAAKKGARTPITGALSKNYTHNERSKHDAILVGSETYLTDKPMLTTRIKGYEHKPIRIIADRRARTDSRDGFYHARHHSDISDLLEHLALEKGITRLLVEGGAEIHQAFLESNLVDQFFLFQSQKELGSDGVSAPYIDKLEEYGLSHIKTRTLGEDKLDIYIRNK